MQAIRTTVEMGKGMFAPLLKWVGAVAMGRELHMRIDCCTKPLVALAMELQELQEAMTLSHIAPLGVVSLTPRIILLHRHALATKERVNKEHGAQGVCLNVHNKDWLKELAKEIPEAKWEIHDIHDHPYQTALGSGQHSGLSKFNKLPNDHPQGSYGPNKTSALISTDQPQNYCNIDEAPQNSSSQNLTLLGQCKAITCKFTTTCYFLYGLHADPIYRLHHCSCAVGFSCRDRPQNSFLHSLSSSTLLARTRPVWGRGECAIAFSF